MAIGATGLARIRRCYAPCEHWRECRWLAGQRGDNWSNYCAFTGHDPAVWVCISEALLTGPETNCPAGYWAGLAPVDLEAQRATAAERAAEAVSGNLAPILSALNPGIDPATLQGKLDALVAAELISPETAVLLEDKVLAPEAPSGKE